MALEVLSYAGVPLQVMTTKHIGKQHVMTDDGTTYLHTEWTLDASTVLNPATLGTLLNFVTLNPGGARPFIGGQPNTPAIIDTILRAILNQPRQALVFSQSLDGINYNVVLNVPANPSNLSPINVTPVQIDGNANLNPAGVPFLTDCANGPFVERFDLRNDIATKTWFVDIRIVTRVRECQFSPGNGNPVLSNRWTRRMKTDDQFLSYIETTGEVVFDSAWLLALGSDTSTPGIIKWGRLPDQYRIDLFQPLPPNSVREDILVEQDSDGITYRYSFRDQERFFNALPACKFEAWQTEGFSQQGQESAIAQSIVEKIADPHATVAAFGLGGILAARFQTIIRSIPKKYTHIMVRAWGNRDTPKWTLLAMAFNIAEARVPNLKNVELIITWELSGKFVEVQMTNRSGPEEALPLLPLAITDALNAIQRFRNAAVAGNNALIAFFGVGGIPPLDVGTGLTMAKLVSGPENDPQAWFHQNEANTQAAFIGRMNIPGGAPSFAQAFPTGPTTGLNQKSGNMQPPNSGYTRGTMVCNLIAQALHSPCTPPPCPPAIAVKPDISVCGKTSQPAPPPTTPDVGNNPGTVSLGFSIAAPTNPPPLQSGIAKP